jgi:glycosyltransferase involved in cell wall biosynthesis
MNVLKKRILILGPTEPSIGGITTAVNNLMGSNLKNEYDLRLVTNSNHRPMNKKGVIDLHNIISAIIIIYELVKEIYFFRPNIVQVETAGEIGFLKQSIYILISRLLHCKVIVSLHCANDAEPLTEFYKHSRISRWYCCYVLRRCQMIKLLSSKWRNSFTNRWGIDSEKIICIQNCLDNEFPWGTALSHSLRLESIMIVSVGSVGERKGSYLLIEAIRRMSDVGINASLFLVGPEERNGGILALQEAARLGGVENRVHLLGGQTREHTLEILSKADVFALPSYAEGMPYSIIEALAIGCPVVASDVGAISDIIRNEETGLLIEAGNVEQLYDALCRMAEDGNIRANLSVQGNKYACKEFSINKLESLLRSVYEKIH